MIVPIPLCAFRITGVGTGDILGNEANTECGFIGWEDVRDVPSKYVQTGVRIGGQTGRYGAEIEMGEFDSYLIQADSKHIYNGVWHTADYTWSDSLRGGPYGRMIPAAASWTDGQRFWAAWGYVCVGVWGGLISETDTIFKLKPIRGFSGVQVHGLYCLTKDEFEGLVKGSAQSRYWGARCAVPMGASVVYNYDWTAETEREAPSLRELWDSKHFASVFKSVATLVAAQRTPQDLANRGGAGDYVQPLHGIDPYPALKAIPTLLNTFEFNDPALANGCVGKTTHYEARAASPNAFDRLRRRSPQDQQVLVPRGRPYGEDMFEWLVQHAWVDAANSIEQASMNSLMNIRMLIEALIALKNGNVASLSDDLYKKWLKLTSTHSGPRELQKTVSSLWMRGRYEVGTTNMDIDQYIRVGRDALNRYFRSIRKSRTHGSATYTKDGQEYKCTCSMTWQNRALQGFEAMYHALWRGGLDPTLYVLWDFIPFSFVADWFMPIGDVLEAYSESSFRSSAYYSFDDIVFSIRYRTGPIAGMYASHYVRWVATEPPVVDHTYWWDKGGATTSSTTICKRVVDAGCLLAGARPPRNAR